jgi:Ca2+-dependent lipid-binding protein
MSERRLTYRPEDVVIMDWAISFTPSDIMDITKRQALAQVNPKIVLSIRLGKGFVSKALPILLEDINFTGRMRSVQNPSDCLVCTDVSGSSYSS